LVVIILVDVIILIYFDISGDVGIEPGFDGKKNNSFCTEMLFPPFKVLLIQEKRNVNG
jgi:hypothetical protein